ncbi:hypothetical protein HAX54_025805 [Datura stramonium]|uniref:Uncharacterized protein n=1 Tax=Datura stramonium TaxID=4076 RepID=A0ABS8V032_DATST|nr:hypothetical protein [Datura stramonium]
MEEEPAMESAALVVVLLPGLGGIVIGADPKSPNINISVAQAGIGTEVATTEQLAPEMDLSIELDLPALLT